MNKYQDSNKKIIINERWIKIIKFQNNETIASTIILIDIYLYFWIQSTICNCYTSNY